MSRIGKKTIVVPEKVTVKIEKDSVTVKGPNGELSENYSPILSIVQEGNELTVKRPDDQRESKSLHGLTRTLIANMIIGVTTGYSKTLEIIGVGFKVELKGANLLLNLGFSHPIYFMPPTGITFEVPNPNTIKISGIDKQLVGLVSAKLRSFKEPEPYKGKGIKYSTETIRRKAGKTAGK